MLVPPTVRSGAPFAGLTVRPAAPSLAGQAVRGASRTQCTGVAQEMSRGHELTGGLYLTPSARFPCQPFADLRCQLGGWGIRRPPPRGPAGERASGSSPASCRKVADAHAHLSPRRREPAVEELGQLQPVGVDGAVRFELRNPCLRQALGGLLALGVEHRLAVLVERRLGRQVHPQLPAAAHGHAVLLHGVDEAGESPGSMAAHYRAGRRESAVRHHPAKRARQQFRRLRRCTSRPRLHTPLCAGRWPFHRSPPGDAAPS